MIVNIFFVDRFYTCNLVVIDMYYLSFTVTYKPVFTFWLALISTPISETGNQPVIKNLFNIIIVFLHFVFVNFSWNICMRIFKKICISIPSL